MRKEVRRSFLATLGIAVFLLLGACSTEPEATPTPTKTPLPTHV